MRRRFGAGAAIIGILVVGVSVTMMTDRFVSSQGAGTAAIFAVDSQDFASSERAAGSVPENFGYGNGGARSRAIAGMSLEEEALLEGSQAGAAAVGESSAASGTPGQNSLRSEETFAGEESEDVLEEALGDESGILDSDPSASGLQKNGNSAETETGEGSFAETGDLLEAGEGPAAVGGKETVSGEESLFSGAESFLEETSGVGSSDLGAGEEEMKPGTGTGISGNVRTGAESAQGVQGSLRAGTTASETRVGASGNGNASENLQETTTAADEETGAEVKPGSADALRARIQELEEKIQEQYEQRAAGGSASGDTSPHGVEYELNLWTQEMNFISDTLRGKIDEDEAEAFKLDQLEWIRKGKGASGQSVSPTSGGQETDSQALREEADRTRKRCYDLIGEYEEILDRDAE